MTAPGQAQLKVDLTDPELFAGNRFWGGLEWLRANEPVYWHPEAGGGGFWVLSRHAEVSDAYSRHAVFSSRFGMRLDSNPEAIAAVSQRMLIVSDPPVHTELKRVLGRAFGPRETRRVTGMVHRVVTEVLDGALARRELDFVDCARLLPNHVVCAMMGVPRSDWEWLGAVTTSAFESESAVERSGAHAEIFMYFSDLLQERYRHPGDDLVSMMAHETRMSAEGPKALATEEVVFNCNGILAGANETTRYSSAGGVLALMEHPQQWHWLAGADEAGVGLAVEEILRWTTPGVHAMRTATEDTTIGTTPIAAGDRVTLWNISANRDAAVFAQPDEFRLSRTPNRHLTFGHGHHMCLGARLARLEMQCFFTELVQRVESVEPLGEAEFIASNFTWGVSSLPVRLIPRRQ